MVRFLLVQTYQSVSTDKLEFMNIKNFCSEKDNVKRMRRQAADWEKIFRKDTPAKGLSSKIYKELLKLNNKKVTKLILKMAKDFNRQLIKKIYRWQKSK